MKFFQDKKSTHKFSGVFRSRIQDENVTMPELALGYFLEKYKHAPEGALIIGKEKMPYNMHKMTNDTHSHLQKKQKYI